MNAVPWSDLALGATVLLAIGTVASLAIRSPHDRHRAGAATTIALLCWLGLALAPLPRFLTDAAPAVPMPPAAHTDTHTFRPVHSAPLRFEERAPLRFEVDRPMTPARAGAAATGRTAAARVDVAALLRTSWVLGSLAVAGLLLIGHASLRRILRRATAAGPEVAALARSAWPDESDPPAVLISGDATRPFCCGIRRPTVVVPRALCAPRLRYGLAHVLSHEFAHLRHRDLPVQALFAIAMVPFWWNPLLWWLRARTRFAAELVADALAAAASDRHTYARGLVEVAASAPRAARIPTPVLSVFERESDFSRRMKMLLARRSSLAVHSRRTMRLTRAAVALLAVAGTAGLFGRPALIAQDPVRTQDPEEAVDVLTKLRTVKAVHRFEDAELVDIAKFYSTLTGVVFVFDPSIDETNPERGKLKDFALEECSVADALDAIAKEMDIHWGVRDGVVLLSYRPIRTTEAIERLLGNLRAARAVDPVTGGERSMDFDLLCRMLGDTGDNLRAAVGDWRPGKAETVVTDLVTLLRVENRKLAERVAQLEAKTGAGQQSPGRDWTPTFDLGAIADLATRAIEARTEVRTAEASYARIKPLVEAEFVEHSEVEKAEIRVQLAAEKWGVLRTLVTSEREALAIEVAAAKDELRTLQPDDPRRAGVESRLRRLLGYVRVLDAAG